MIPSKILRKIISQRLELNLDTYSWSEEFEKRVMAIYFRENDKIYTFKDVYEKGCNIGNCLLTSKYISQTLRSSTICAGKVEILKGTKNSKNGDHVWVEVEDLIIDPTLMISIPKETDIAKKYHKECTLAILEHNLELSYSDEFYLSNNEPDLYYTSIFRITDEKE